MATVFSIFNIILMLVIICVSATLFVLSIQVLLLAKKALKVYLEKNSNTNQS
ncbi:MAG: hypothetical protein RRZ73_06625 [Oscillospiraceae bacterium]